MQIRSAGKLTAQYFTACEEMSGKGGKRDNRGHGKSGREQVGGELLGCYLQRVAG